MALKRKSRWNSLAIASNHQIWTSMLSRHYWWPEVCEIRIIWIKHLFLLFNEVEFCKACLCVNDKSHGGPSLQSHTTNNSIICASYLDCAEFIQHTTIFCCSRKRFTEKQAEQWWAENRARVYDQYNVRMIDKSSVGVGSEDLAHWHGNGWV